MRRSCQTCRFRRRACDRGRPECLTCKQSGRLCDGYNDFVFVAPNRSATAKVQHKPKQLAKSSQSSATSGRISSWADGPDDMAFQILQVPEMTEDDFKEHTRKLLSILGEEHAQTSHAWSLHLRKLAGDTAMLDLASIALSTLRLSQASTDQDELMVTSLTAYNRSIRIFQRYCSSTAKLDRQSCPKLAVLCLTYSLYEFMQETPDTILDSTVIASNLHLNGLEFFLRKAGPVSFRDEGYHQAYQKAREMLLLASLARHEASFLARNSWMVKPWSDRPKTTRDELYDVVSSLTVFRASNNPTRGTAPWKSGLQALTRQLDGLETNWLSSQQVQSPSVACSTWNSKDSLTTDSVLTILEILVVRLLSQLVLYEVDENPHQGDGVGSLQIPTIRDLLRLPLFRRHQNRRAGIVEADCRSLLAIFTLKECGKLKNMQSIRSNSNASQTS